MKKYLKLILSVWLILFQFHLSNAQIGNVLVLDGCTNYFEVEENDLLDYNQVLSIECWVQPNCGYDENENQVFLSKQWCAGEYAYYLSVFDGKLCYISEINKTSRDDYACSFNCLASISRLNIGINHDSAFV